MAEARVASISDRNPKFKMKKTSGPTGSHRTVKQLPADWAGPPAKPDFVTDIPTLTRTCMLVVALEKAEICLALSFFKH